MPRSLTVIAHLRPPARRALDADPAAIGAVLDRVADQVLKDAAQRRLRRRRPAADRPGCSTSTVEPRGVDQRGRGAQHAVNQRVDADRRDGQASAGPNGCRRTRGSARPSRSAAVPRSARARRTSGPAPRRGRRRRPGCRPAARTTASGVRSSCETVATNSICCRASSCERRVDDDHQHHARGEHAENAAC